MTILMLIPDFGKGGAERVFAQLSAALGAHHRVIDCVFNRANTAQYVSGNQLVDLNVPPGKTVIFKAFYFCLRIWRLRRIKRKLGVDLTISHLEGADYVNLLSRINDKAILCVHGTKIHDGNIRGALGWIRLNIMLPFLYRRASQIVAVSAAIRHELVSRFRLLPERITVINNFFDLDVIRMKSEEPLEDKYSHLMDNYQVIITCGRLTPQKNQKLLIRLMPELLKVMPDIRLIILGSGPLQDELVVEAGTRGVRVQFEEKPFDLENQVFFPGFRDNPFTFVRKSKLFLLSSLWEGFPLVVCEALACGTPVIAHDCPTGPREILAPESTEAGALNDVLFGEYGVLIPFSEKLDAHVLNLWARAVVMVLNSAEIRKRYVDSSRVRAGSFGREVIVREWTGLINSQ